MAWTKTRAATVKGGECKSVKQMHGVQSVNDIVISGIDFTIESAPRQSSRASRACIKHAGVAEKQLQVQSKWLTAEHKSSTWLTAEQQYGLLRRSLQAQSKYAGLAEQQTGATTAMHACLSVEQHCKGNASCERNHGVAHHTQAGEGVLLAEKITGRWQASPAR